MLPVSVPEGGRRTRGRGYGAYGVPVDGLQKYDNGGGVAWLPNAVTEGYELRAPCLE